MSTAGLFSSVIVIFITLVTTVQTIPPVVLTVDQAIIELGQPLNLSCESKKSNISGSRIWTGGKHDDVLCLNSVSKYPQRYSEHHVTAHKYNLTIESLSENDLDCLYGCHFGFDSDQKLITVDNINLLKMPSENTTQYVKQNGSYILSVFFKKVYPVPDCKLINKRLSKTLTLKTQDKDGIFYDIHFVDHLEETFHLSESPLTIECTLKTKKYNINIEHNFESISAVSGTNENKSTHTILITVILACAGVLGVVVFVLFIFIKTKSNYRRRNQRSKNSNIDIEGSQECCEPLNHDTKVSSLTLQVNECHNNVKDNDFRTNMLH